MWVEASGSSLSGLSNSCGLLYVPVTPQTSSFIKLDLDGQIVSPPFLNAPDAVTPL